MALQLVLCLAATIDNSMTVVEIDKDDVGSGVWLATAFDDKTGKEDGTEQYKCKDIAEVTAAAYTVKKAKKESDVKDAQDKCESAIKALEAINEWDIYILGTIYRSR